MIEREKGEENFKKNYFILNLMNNKQSITARATVVKSESNFYRTR
jgi:hypothetical protein